MAGKRKEGLKQNWFTIKYIKAIQNHQTHHIPMKYLLKLCFFINESRKFCLKPTRYNYTSCYQNSTFFHQAISLSFFFLLLFSEILIKISFNTQAKRQITFQSWDKMKLLTERMGSSNSHTSIQKKTSNFLSRYLQQGGHSAFQSHKPVSANWLPLSLCLHMTPGLSQLEH